jgi:hypothetical protein
MRRLSSRAANERPQMLVRSPDDHVTVAFGPAAGCCEGEPLMAMRDITSAPGWCGGGASSTGARPRDVPERTVLHHLRGHLRGAVTAGKASGRMMLAPSGS